MDLLSNIDESQWKNEDPKNIQGIRAIKLLQYSRNSLAFACMVSDHRNVSYHM